MTRLSYTIYLAKNVLVDFDQYLTENAKSRIGRTGHQRLEVDGLGEQSTLHVFQGNTGPPTWMMRLSQRLPELQLVNRRSVAALLFVNMRRYVLAISYAHGWMHLNENMFESDFGLRVAINALDSEKLKRLERSNLGDALQGVSQSPFQRDFTSFGVDDALDLVKKLSGAAQDNSGLDTISGSRSLKITGEFTLDDVVAMSRDIVDLFDSKAYRNTVFRIIDSVRPVTDGVLRDELLQLAVDSIKANEDRFELGLPANTEAEGVSFRFHGPGLKRSFPDLLLRHYVDAMGDKINNIDIQTLTNHKIVSEFDDDRSAMVWPLKKALLGSLSRNGERYAINDGQWYRVDNTFRDAIEHHFRNIVRDWDIQRPSPILKIYDENGNGRIETEPDYNTRIAGELGLVLLDTTEITIPDQTRSGFEPCDLLDVRNRRFIHVKKNSRRSNILSHFFKQGSNSGQQFRKVDATWSQLVELVREAGHDAEADLLAAQTDRQGQGWTVEFWIVDAPRYNGEFNIPFFSKISLRDEATELRAMQYDVALRFIEIPPDNI